MTWDLRYVLPLGLSVVLLAATVRRYSQDRRVSTLVRAMLVFAMAAFMLFASATPTLNPPWTYVFWTLVAVVLLERLVAFVRLLAREDPG